MPVIDPPVPCYECGEVGADPVGETYLCQECLQDRRERLKEELEALVQSEKYRNDLFEIITADVPSRDRKLWAAGFLAEGVGLGENHAAKFLGEYIEWNGAHPATGVELAKAVVDSS